MGCLLERVFSPLRGPYRCQGERGRPSCEEFSLSALMSLVR